MTPTARILSAFRRKGPNLPEPNDEQLGHLARGLGQTNGILAPPFPECKPRREHGDAGGKCRKTPVFGQRVRLLKPGLNISNNSRSRQAHATPHLHPLDRHGVRLSGFRSRRCQTHQHALDYGAGHG